MNIPVAPADLRLAITAQSLYLLNFLLFPGLAFLATLWLLFRNPAPGFARRHLLQSVGAQVLGGALLAGGIGAIALLGDLQGPGAWVVLILYGVCMHAAVVLTGVLALVRTLAGQPFSYPGLRQLGNS